MSVVYTAATHTTGGRQGESYSSDGNLDIQLTAPGAEGTGTNPEQLFAAGWSACYLSAMGLVAGQHKVKLPAETAVDIAARDGVVAGLVVADALAHLGLPVVEFESAAQRYAARTGARLARAVSANVEPLTESPGESRVRWICHCDGIRLVPQVVVRDGQGRFVARVDFVVEGTNVVVEFDGLGKYADRETLRAEKRRQVALERLGYVVVRLVHADLGSPTRVVQLVREATERAHRQRGA